MTKSKAKYKEGYYKLTCGSGDEYPLLNKKRRWYYSDTGGKASPPKPTETVQYLGKRKPK